jgi:hypothetical protein
VKEVRVRLSDDLETFAWTFNGTAQGRCSRLVVMPFAVE